MNENHQEMRQRLDETKAHLFAKLQLLEEQITETIEATGTKVKSTVGAVESAVVKVSNALDVRRQFNRHPWLWLGGALAAGYAAGGIGRRRALHPKKPTPIIHGIDSQDVQAVDASAVGIGAVDSEKEPAAAASISALAAAYELGSKQSTVTQARSLALNATVRIFEEIVSRSVPILIAYIVKKHEERSK